MNNIIIITAVLVMAVWITRKCFSKDSFFYVLDKPNDRSLHSEPVPKTGGIGIISTTLVAWGVLLIIHNRIDLVWILILPVLSLSILGFIDDLKNIHQLPRLMVHLGLTVLVVALGIKLEFLSLLGVTVYLPGWIMMIISGLFILWMMNLYNFMDGMDGFSGGMSAIGFTTLAVMGFINHQELYAMLALVVALASAGFLIWNFPPAKIFMGDCGSVPLGFVAGVFIIWGVQLKVIGFTSGLVIFSPFIFDATITLIKRIIKREPIWEAHRSHYYQQLVTFGWGHKKTVLTEYGFMFLCSISVIAMKFMSLTAQNITIVLLLIMYVCLIVMLETKLKYQVKS